MPHTRCMPKRTVAIVGAGASGTLLAIHLLTRGPKNLHVRLIEARHRFGLGLAYASTSPNHLLNVPAAGMSAFPDDPDHFVRWLGEQADAEARGFGPWSFVPRQRYGQYLREVLASTLKQGHRSRVEMISGRVTGLREFADRIALTLADDRHIDADQVVLALGNFPPAPPLPIPEALVESGCYQPDPWAACAFEGLDPHAPVLLIGTGLTMVDVVLALLDQGHIGPIQAVSRRGLLPRTHRLPPEPLVIDTIPYSDVRRLCRWLRCEIDARQGDWRAVIDGLRPHTQGLWARLPHAQRERFLRHLRPWWDVHRHRLSPPVAGRLTDAMASGQVTVHAGRLAELESTESGAAVWVRPRGGGAAFPINTTRIINCAGPDCDFARIRDPLVRRLLADGRIQPDALRLGLAVDAHGELLNEGGEATARLFAIGPLTRGQWWEITAVPDIRKQSIALADHLLSLDSP